MLAQPGVELHASEQPVAAEIEVKQSEDAALGKAAREFFQFVELPGEVTATHQRADRGAGDHRDLYAGFVERAQHPDMSPTAGTTAAQRKRDAGLLWRSRIGNAARR